MLLNPWNLNMVIFYGHIIYWVLVRVDLFMHIRRCREIYCIAVINWFSAQPHVIVLRGVSCWGQDGW